MTRNKQKQHAEEIDRLRRTASVMIHKLVSMGIKACDIADRVRIDPAAISGLRRGDRSRVSSPEKLRSLPAQLTRIYEERRTELLTLLLAELVTPISFHSDQAIPPEAEVRREIARRVVRFLIERSQRGNAGPRFELPPGVNGVVNQLGEDADYLYLVSGRDPATLLHELGHICDRLRAHRRDDAGPPPPKPLY
jgi:hypothetical protein